MSPDEERAFHAFCRMRWPETNGTPICPKCGTVGAYFLASRRRFICKNLPCHSQYTPTSGTIFHGRKLPYAALLAALEVFAEPASTNAAARWLGLAGKTAFVLKAKIAETQGRIRPTPSQQWKGYWQRRRRKGGKDGHAQVKAQQGSQGRQAP